MLQLSHSLEVRVAVQTIMSEWTVEVLRWLSVRRKLSSEAQDSASTGSTINSASDSPANDKQNSGRFRIWE